MKGENDTPKDNTTMKVHLDCIPCFLRQALQAARFATDDREKHEEVLRTALTIIDRSSWHATPSEIGQSVHLSVMDVLGNNDPYRDEKIRSNEIVLAMYGELQREIERADDPVNAAIRFSIAGNIMDYGAKAEFNIHETLVRVAAETFRIDSSHELEEDFKHATTIAYLVDNAGEIVFDRLLMETVDWVYGEKEWHVFVKSHPIINDATMDTAIHAGLNGRRNVLLDVVRFSHEHDDRTDPPFLERLATHDVVISKGQGNFEAMSEVKGVNLYFLLMAKCFIVSDDLGVDTGDLLVIKKS